MNRYKRNVNGYEVLVGYESYCTHRYKFMCSSRSIGILK